MIVGEEKQFTALGVRPKTQVTLMARLSPGGDVPLGDVHNHIERYKNHIEPCKNPTKKR